MSVYGATTAAYAAPTTTYAAAPATYATPMASYGAAMPAYGAGMSYVPQATYGAYGGMQASPYLSTDVIETQKLDATNALKNQHKLQADMLEHQYNAQKAHLKADYDRNVTMATQQFEQQRLQQEMALDQQ